MSGIKNIFLSVAALFTTATAVSAQTQVKDSLTTNVTTIAADSTKAHDIGRPTTKGIIEMNDAKFVTSDYIWPTAIDHFTKPKMHAQYIIKKEGKTIGNGRPFDVIDIYADEDLDQDGNIDLEEVSEASLSTHVRSYHNRKANESTADMIENSNMTKETIVTEELVRELEYRFSDINEDEIKGLVMKENVVDEFTDRQNPLLNPRISKYLQPSKLTRK